MVSILIFLLVFEISIRNADGICTFPIAGAWVTSDKGTLTFTSTTIVSFPTNHFGPLTFTCDTQSGNKYMAISSSFSHFGVLFEAYICLELTQISANKYTFFMGSDFNATVGNERIKSAATGAALGFSDVCDRTVYEDGTYSVMMKEGTISSESIDCPASLQSTWQYSYDDGSGSSACATGSECDVCSDTQTLMFNYTICTQTIMYSSKGILHCFYQSTIGSNTYLHVYNTDDAPDETTTYRFTCLVMTSSSSATVYMTQYPQNCETGQTSTSVSSPGATMVFSQIATCPSTVTTSTSVNSTSTSVISTSTEESTTESAESTQTGIGSASVAIIAIVVILLIAAITVIIVIIIWKYNEKKKDNTKPTPDPKYANGEVRNFRRCKHDGVVPDIVVVSESKSILDETMTPRKEEGETKVEKLQKLNSFDDGRSSLDSAGALSVRRESSIVVSIPTSRSDMERVSETEEDETEAETETEHYEKNETESKEVETILEIPEQETTLTSNGDISHEGKPKERKRRRRKLRKSKSSISIKVKPKSPVAEVSNEEKTPRGDKSMNEDRTQSPRHGVAIKSGSPRKGKASNKMVNLLNCKDKVSFGTVPTVLLKIESPGRKRKKSIERKRPKTSTSMKSIKEEEPLDLDEKLHHLRQMQTGYLQEMRKRRQSVAQLKTTLQLTATKEAEGGSDANYNPWRRTASAKRREDSNRPISQDGSMVTHGMTSDPVVPSPETPTTLMGEKKSKTFFEPKTVELEPDEVWDSIANMWNLRNQYISDSFIKLTNENK